MKTVKSLLLGTAAAVVTMAGANAADLRAAPPVQFVQVCDAAGAGFWVIPGTDVCLSVNGTVSMGLYVQSSNFAQQGNNNANAGALRLNPFFGTPGGTNILSPNLNPSTFIFANGRVQTRSFQRTDIGIIRTTINIQGDTGAVGDINVGLRQAWVSITNSAGVFTAGLTETFFAPAAGVGIGSGVTNSPASLASGLGFSNATILGNEAGARRAAFAYTAVLAPNATATIAIENNVMGGAGGGAFAATQTGGGSIHLQGQIGGLAATGAAASGQVLPAVVANVMLGTTASGNFFALSGALVNNRVLDNGTAAAGATGGTFGTTGWAVAATAGLNADVISRGSRFGVRVAYTDGATQYLGNGAPAINAWFSRTNGPAALRNVAGFAASAAYTHQWNPQWRTALYAGFLSMNYRGNAAFAGANVSGGNIFAGQIGSTSFQNIGNGTFLPSNTTLIGWNNTNLLRSAWQVGTTTMWTPVSNFSIGLDLSVVQGRFANTFGGNGSGMGGVRTGYTAILGVRRDF